MSELLIWDSEKFPEVTTGKVVLWRSFSDGQFANIVSAPSLVERDAVTLKQRFLSWLYTLGEAKIQDRKVIDHLELRPGLSYWWILLSAEKCNYSKSPQICDIFRLMALENWLMENRPVSIKFILSGYREAFKK